MTQRLAGKRVLLTQVDRFMGPDVNELFAAEGATIIGDSGALASTEEANRLAEATGPVDVLIANLAESNRPSPIGEISDEDWFSLFDALVHPLMRVMRAVLPGMIERGRGKVVVLGSAAPLRGAPGYGAYCTARGAQLSLVRAVGLEVARHNVQVNAIAQNFVENPTYYPPEMLADTAQVERMKKMIPARRFAKGVETAELALFLASESSDFISGQVIPLAGGWVTTM
ncbi:MAG: SDR family oxidoreductase [Gammaproteobacteria bacterium]|nr:SDR family oxidoreductase [Gammaproteobacteria bacterium]